MKIKEKKIIIDLYKHYKSTEVTEYEIKSLYEKHGDIISIIKNLIQQFDPNAIVTDEYINNKLKEYKSKKNIYLTVVGICLFSLIIYFSIKQYNNSVRLKNEEIFNNSGFVNKNLSLKVLCEESIIESDNIEQTIVKSCSFNNFKSVSIGEADYKGRYSYKYEIFIKKNGEFVKSNNEELFNNKKEELLKLINQKIKIDFDDYATNPETKDCFEGVTFTNYTYENLGIEFTDDKVNFNVWFDVAGYCFNVSSTSVSLSLEEIKPYFNSKY